MASTETFMLGDKTIKRLGYGAMQLASPGVFGPPRIARPPGPCSAKPSRPEWTISTPEIFTVRTSPTS